MNKDLNVITIVGDKPLMQNTYLISTSNTTILADCGAPLSQVEREYKKYYKGRNLPNIDAIFLTHTHFDHCMYLEEFEKTFNMPIFAAKESTAFISDPIHNASPVMSLWLDYEPLNLIELSAEQEVNIGDISILPIFTPGHTCCSMCYKIESVIFTGDTVFYQAVGRTDLPSGNAADLKKSLEKLSKIPADLYYPGHGVPFKKL